MYKLKKQGILHKNKQFQTVYKTGKSYSNRMLVMYVLPNPAQKRRVGFAAGKRLGGAVVRNRVKRLLREAYRMRQHELRQDVDLIIVGRKPAVDSNAQAVTKAFLDLCKRAQILANK
ncbi:ribonuclease P protein component [Propionispora vibrioides]|uniref:ribonuclease P protein component n=1 Tax=Propionispora vibrioides TaxID=112903 RepID=UPI000B87A095|nr:ribonuclease P protein component [Propionispora vibrioides]